MTIPITWWASKKYVRVDTLLKRLDEVMDYSDPGGDNDDVVSRLERLYIELKEAD